MLKKNPEAKLIYIIIKRIVGEPINDAKILLNSVDWEKVKNLFIYHELTPFAYLALRDFKTFLPQNIKEFLKNNYYCALIRCQHLWQEFLRVFDAFQQSGITLLPIKGIALLKDLYTQKTLRPMTDIDILIREEDLQNAELIFNDLGYRKELYGLKEEYWRKNQCHITFYRKEGKKLPFVELHWNLDFKRGSRTILPELWGRIRKVNVDGRIIKLLSPEDTLFSLVLHQRRFGKIFCLKYSLDSALLLKKYASIFNWDYVLREARQGKMCSSLFFIFLEMNFLDSEYIPLDILNQLRIPAWERGLISRFVERNMFSDNMNFKLKNLYLKSHFLLYDSIWESIKYILNVPLEQFAKFYALRPYDKKTEFFYHSRLLYIPFKKIFNLFSKTN